MGKTPCLLHLQVPHQLEPELEAALQNLWLLELDQEALSDKEKRLQQAPQCHHSTVRIYCQKKEIYNFSSYNHLTRNWEDGMSNERKVNKCDKLFNLYFQI